MFYSVLGRIVWFGAKWYTRRRVSRLRAPMPFLTGGVLALAVAAVVVGQRTSD